MTNVQTDCFLVFSDDFGEHPSSCQHIFRHAPAASKVLWVNTIGMRNPTLSLRDLRKAGLKLTRMLQRPQKRGEETGCRSRCGAITVIQPLMLPFQNIPGLRSINRAIVVQTVKMAMTRLKLSKPICVITAPNACDFVGYFGESKVVYYCVDDFSEWPGLDRNFILSMEKTLLAKAGLFFATSQQLEERLKGVGKDVHLLTHGVDHEMFSRSGLIEHPCLSNIPHPRVGYFGLFDERSDQRLLSEVAQRLPHVSFVVTGEVSVDVSALKCLVNFHFTGKVPFDELPNVATGFDICMLPYVKSPLTEAINPLKIKEYLATGKPVISTSLREACALREFVLIVDSPTEWQDAIELALEGASQDENLAKRIAALSSESWQVKADFFFTLCKGGNSSGSSAACR